ncbi:MAG: hypothetical protein ACETWM_00335 [Candidatus Lokiarchaeia archaeon]
MGKRLKYVGLLEQFEKNTCTRTYPNNGELHTSETVFEIFKFSDHRGNTIRRFKKKRTAMVQVIPLPANPQKSRTPPIPENLRGLDPPTNTLTPAKNKQQHEEKPHT